MRHPLALFILLLASPLYAALPDPITIDSGQLSGTTSLTNPDIHIYKGIPYASPPVGNLRWHAPLPPASWIGIREADHFAAACIQPPYAAGSFYQLEFFTASPPEMSEDCLYLNVWTAAQSAGEKRPVMLWIHGGGGVQGYASEPCFDGEALAAHGVILVSFNYRLGIFAHFAHPELSRESDHHVSGNYAELDQIAALQWVNRNIAQFGGDPNNITLFGQSSGGASISRLLICPLAKGLFQKVIIQSAAVLNSKDSKTKLPAMEQRGLTFAKSLNANSLQDLRAMPAQKILDASQKLKFDPTIDGYILPDLPLNCFDKSAQYPVPMLIGSTSDEGPFTPVTAEKFHADIQTRFGKDADGFFHLYPATTDREAAQSKHDARRDESAAGERRQALAQAQRQPNVYLYYFAQKPPGRDSEKYGAFHAAELEYVFNTLSATDRPWQKSDRDLADLMIRYWTNFAATGNPNGPSLPTWPALNPHLPPLREMEFSAASAARPIPDISRLDFLENFLSHEAR